MALRSFTTALVLMLTGCTLVHMPASAQAPLPTQGDVSYGPHPHQLIDIYLPHQSASGPVPVLIWFGGIWEPSKRPPDLNYFSKANVAVVTVETRTLTDGMTDKVMPPVSYLMRDAIRAVQFVRMNAPKWNLDPNRIAAGGSSQGSLPALYVGCSPDHADRRSKDPLLRTSSRVVCVAAHRSQPTIDPERMQKWIPGVQWGAPALGCSFEDSLSRRSELLSYIRTWSPDALLHRGSAPIYFENNWGLTQPDTVSEMDYKVHSPAWGLGFQKLAHDNHVVCYVKYPEHPTEEYTDIWDFVVKRLTTGSKR